MLSYSTRPYTPVFFHIATLPRFAPSFGASQPFFVDHGLPKALIAVSAKTAQNLDLRVVTTPMEVDILTPALLCDQIHIGRGDPEIFRTYGQLPLHVVMPGGSATCDDQRDVPPHLASFVRFVCAVEGPLWYRAVHDGLGGMFCTNDTLYTFMFSPGNSGFVNLARNTVHVDRVFRPSTTPDSVRDGRPWFECTSGDANNVVLDVSPYFLPYGDISIHGVAYASVNNSRAHTPPAQRLTPTVDVSVGCLAALDVEFHVALSGGTSRGRSSGFLLVHGGVHSDRCALSGPLVLQPV